MTEIDKLLYENDLKFAEKNEAYQQTFFRKTEIIYNENIKELALIISRFTDKNTNTNKLLKKLFTENKRKLRNELIELIQIGIENGKILADKKNDSFLSIVEKEYA